MCIPFDLQIIKLWKAASQMRGEVKTVAKAAVRTYYRFHESTTEKTKSNVEWLLAGSVFAYGGVDLKVYIVLFLFFYFILFYFLIKTFSDFPNTSVIFTGNL